jgi:hypothetical protein
VEVNLSSCRLEVADFRKIVIAEQYFFKKFNCYCESASFKLRSSDCRLQKMLRVPISGKNITVPFGHPAISLHSHHVSLVQLTTCLLPVTRDPGSNPQGVLK